MKRFIVTANTKDEAIEKVKKHLAKDAYIKKADAPALQDKIQEIFDEIIKEDPSRIIDEHGLMSIADTEIWHELKDRGVLNEFPSNLYQVIHDVLDRRDNVMKVNEIVEKAKLPKPGDKFIVTSDIIVGNDYDFDTNKEAAEFAKANGLRLNSAGEIIAKKGTTCTLVELHSEEGGWPSFRFKRDTVALAFEDDELSEFMKKVNPDVSASIKDEPSRAEEIDELKKKFENKDKLLEEKFDALEKECQSLLDEIVDKMTDYYEKYHADLDALKELNESYEVTKNGFKFHFYPQYGEMIIDIHDMANVIPDEMINNIDAELFEEDEDPKADIAKSIKRLKELKERLSLLDSDELIEDAFDNMSKYVVKLLEARNKSVGLDAKAKDDKPAEKRIVIEMSDEHIIEDVEKNNPKVDFFLKHIIDGYETWLLSSFEVTALEKAIADIKKALE